MVIWQKRDVYKRQVLAGAGSQGIAEASVQLLANTGVKLATRDFFTGMEEAFENETLAVAIGCLLYTSGVPPSTTAINVYTSRF